MGLQAQACLPLALSRCITRAQCWRWRKRLGSSCGGQPLCQQLAGARPLLTPLLGPHVQIEFDVSGRVSGAAISTYLLERSRVVSIADPERSYHIFYQLLAGVNPHQRTALR